MTVSRVINKVPGRKFSEATAQRVREAIELLGYEPNRVARSLRGQRSGVIGLVTTNVTDPFWASCARGVELEARRQNYVPILVASDEDCLLEERQVAALQAHRVDGLLLVSTYRARQTTLYLPARRNPNGRGRSAHRRFQDRLRTDRRITKRPTTPPVI